MLDLILKVLSVLGIILLTLVLLLLAVALLALFFPVTYRIRGSKTAEKAELSAGANWLFGLLRVRCSYPEPGTLTAKFLWFKLYHTKLPPDAKEKSEQSASGGDKDAQLSFGKKAKSQAESKPDMEETRSGESAGGREREEIRQEGETGQEEPLPEGDTGQEEPLPGEETGQEEPLPGEDTGQEEPLPGEDTGQGVSRQEQAAGQDENGSEEPRDGFLKKIQKLKYTICNIYDKIKEIWKNISYYTALLQEENTRQLWAYGKLRAAKILKNIRPRHIRADILFGTGSPDTTGYFFGMYCMLYSVLGARVQVTPDFERAVLEGRLDISGHITVFVLVVNIVRLMMDKKLQAFIKKLKKEASHSKGASHHK